MADADEPIHVPSAFAMMPSPQLKTYMDRLDHDQHISFGEDLLEATKIIGLSVAGAVAFGITHDMVTTHINLDYFASNRTHHGPVTRDDFPFVYETNSPILYALLWGTIATWWVGLASGVVVASSARIGSSVPKLTWDELLVPVATTMGATLAMSLLVGAFSALTGSDSFDTVANMHSAAYTAGAVFSLALAGYTITKRFEAPPASPTPPKAANHLSNINLRPATYTREKFAGSSIIVPLVNVNW